MARPAYTLEQHVRQGSFRSRRHHSLLAGERLPATWLPLANLQVRYQAATSDAERAQIGLAFEKIAAAAYAQALARGGGLTGPSLDEQLAVLGKPGSLTRLLGFFPALLQHRHGQTRGRPFRLERFQQAFLREFHRRDRSGRRLYKKGLLGLPRGNGKTPLAAGLGLYELVRNRDAPEIVIAAGSREQARITLEYARGLMQGPLGEWIVANRDRLSCPSRQGRMETLASHGLLQYGRAPSAALVDELWTFRTDRQKQTYTALTTAVHKRRDAYLLATSTAGPDLSSLLGSIYQTALAWEDVTVSRDGCLTVAKNIEAAALVWWYAAPADADPEDPKILDGCNPASWINSGDLLRQLRDPGLNESEFRRLHLNQWPSPRRAQPESRYPIQSPEGSVNDDGRSLPNQEDAAVASEPSTADRRKLSWDELIARIQAHVNGG
jgi:hypothetical protein